MLENAGNSKLREARGILIELVESACKAADPSAAILRNVKVEGKLLYIAGEKFDLRDIEKIVVVGGGKAGGAMAETIERILGDRISSGIVCVPENVISSYCTRKIKLIGAGHPLPTKSGEKGAEKILAKLSKLGPKDMVIYILSGGGSALISLPERNVTLDELRETTDVLIKSGANIQEVNAVRKHLCQMKGGKVAKVAYPASVVSLIISDVVENRLDTIASGPTCPDNTTFKDALRVIEKYGLYKKVPSNVLNRLKMGEKRKSLETPKPRDVCFNKVHNVIIASNYDALKAASGIGGAHGLNVKIITRAMQGEAREVGEYLASIAKTSRGRSPVKPSLFLLGGETTVTVVGNGTGGRNQELALSASIHISDLMNTALASFSTDGVDGPTDAAGAMGDYLTIKRAKKLGLDPKIYLDNNNSYHFFRELKDLLKTGPTGTNVMDITALLSL